MSEDVTIAVFRGCIDQNETAHKLLATLNCITVQHITVTTYHFLCKSYLSATQQHFKSGSNDIIIAVVNIKKSYHTLREQQTFSGPSAFSCS